ncbi:MAG: hypothetical protein JW797_19515 [Bradymonadales bacterium]|nr:hypothetical protein [Bradymonadales bacterium]
MGVSLLLCFCFTCKGCGPSLQELASATHQAAAIAHQARQAAHREADRSTVELALQAARHIVTRAALGFDPSGEAAYTASCAQWLQAEDLPRASACLQQATAQGLDGIELRLLQARLLLAEERYPEARQRLFALRDRQPDHLEIPRLLLAAFSQDPIFNRPVETLVPGVQIDQIRALGGGSTLTMRLRRDGETIAAFKPNQTRRQSNYRAEVAAFRLCPVIRCIFEVPYSFEVRIELRHFLRLYGIRSLGEGTGYASNFSDLVWTRDNGRQYLHGVWKDWVPHFTKFPIEYEDVWTPWVSVDGDLDALDQPLADALAPLRGRPEGNYDDILAEAASATTRDLATQISNLLVFDFLINNWDRFSTAYLGVNCQWADGRFVSIDNGAGFMTRDPHRPRTHLHQLSRFSRRLVREVRELDREALLPLLFPDPTAEEQLQYQAFLDRVDEFLAYVDDLIEQYGHEAVLAFD